MYFFLPACDGWYILLDVVCCLLSGGLDVNRSNTSPNESKHIWMPSSIFPGTVRSIHSFMYHPPYRIDHLVKHKDLKGNESRPVDQRQGHTRVIEQLADISGVHATLTAQYVSKIEIYHFL